MGVTRFYSATVRDKNLKLFIHMYKISFWHLFFLKFAGFSCLLFVLLVLSRRDWRGLAHVGVHWVRGVKLSLIRRCLLRWRCLSSILSVWVNNLPFIFAIYPFSLVVKLKFVSFLSLSLSYGLHSSVLCVFWSLLYSHPCLRLLKHFVALVVSMRVLTYHWWH
jgi:hypothetical protein